MNESNATDIVAGKEPDAVTGNKHSRWRTYVAAAAADWWPKAGGVFRAFAIVAIVLESMGLWVCGVIWLFFATLYFVRTGSPLSNFAPGSKDYDWRFSSKMRLRALVAVPLCAVVDYRETDYKESLKVELRDEAIAQDERAMAKIGFFSRLALRVPWLIVTFGVVVAGLVWLAVLSTYFRLFKENSKVPDWYKTYLPSGVFDRLSDAAAGPWRAGISVATAVAARVDPEIFAMRVEMEETRREELQDKIDKL